MKRLFIRWMRLSTKWRICQPGSKQGTRSAGSRWVFTCMQPGQVHATRRKISITQNDVFLDRKHHHRWDLSGINHRLQYCKNTAMAKLIWYNYDRSSAYRVWRQGMATVISHLNLELQHPSFTLLPRYILPAVPPSRWKQWLVYKVLKKVSPPNSLHLLKEIVREMLNSAHMVFRRASPQEVRSLITVQVAEWVANFLEPTKELRYI